MSHAKTNEPFWWLLFSAGGMAAAFVAPVLILLIFLAASHGWTSTPAAPPPGHEGAHYALTYWHLKALLGHWMVKLGVWVSISLPLFHTAHRIRHTFEEFGFNKTLMAGFWYLTAIVGTVLCGVALLHI